MPEGWTNFHCHTNVDWVCEKDLTPEVYVGYLDGHLRRAVLTDHGFMYYWYDKDVIFRAEWLTNPALFDEKREWGNERVRKQLAAVRSLANPNLFVGIETDMMADGRLTHDPAFNDEFDVIVCSIHFMPWLKPDLSDGELWLEWLKVIERMAFTPEVDVLGHPMRSIMEKLKVRQVPADILAELARIIEQSRVSFELNVPANPRTYEMYTPLLGALVKVAAERGFPVTFGTDSHSRSVIANFEPHKALLAALGLNRASLNLREVEDFLARKGRRGTRESRPWGAATAARRPEGGRAKRPA